MCRFQCEPLPIGLFFDEFIPFFIIIRLSQSAKVSVSYDIIVVCLYISSPTFIAAYYSYRHSFPARLQHNVPCILNVIVQFT